MKDQRRFHLIGFFASAYLNLFVLAVVWLALWRPALEGGWGFAGATPVGVSLGMFQGRAPAAPAQTAAPSAVSQTNPAPTSVPQPAVEPQATPEATPQPQPKAEPVPGPRPKAEPGPRPKPKPKPKPKLEPAPTPKPTSKPQAQPRPEPKPPATVKPRSPLATHPSGTSAAATSVRPAVTESGASPASSKGETSGVPGRGSGAAPQDSEEVKADRKAFLRGLRQAISRYQFFPEEAARRRETGTALVGFVLESDGSITGIHLQRSSGSPLLDETARETLRRLGHYKPIPPELGRSHWKMAVPIAYELVPGD